MPAQVKLIAFAAVSAALLSACSSRVETTVDLFERALFGAEDITLTAEEIADYPYAAQYVRLGDSARALAVLNFVDHHELKWRAATDEVIITHFGRVTAMHRVPGAVRYTSHIQYDPLACLYKTLRTGDTSSQSLAYCINTYEFTREVGDVGQQSNEHQRVQASVKFGSFESRDAVNGERLNVLPVTESLTITTHQGEQLATNEYWLEKETGRVIESRQYMSQDSGYLHLQEIQAFSGDLKEEGDNQ